MFVCFRICGSGIRAAVTACRARAEVLFRELTRCQCTRLHTPCFCFNSKVLTHLTSRVYFCFNPLQGGVASGWKRVTEYIGPWHVRGFEVPEIMIIIIILQLCAYTGHLWHFSVLHSSDVCVHASHEHSMHATANCTIGFMSEVEWTHVTAKSIVITPLEICVFCSEFFISHSQSVFTESAHCR